jgi:hypothetical protein
MEHFPKVMVGGPIRDRAWIAPTWLNALMSLEWPAEKLTLAVLENDSRDRTAAVCRWWLTEAAMLGVQTHFGSVELGSTRDNNVRRGRDYEQFARARDAWVALRTDHEWLLQVDSDVQVSPETLVDLVRLAQGHGLKMLAAVIDNSDGSALEWFTNVMQARGDGGFQHDNDAWQDFGPGVRPCALTGAVVLLHRSIFDSVEPEVDLVSTVDGRCGAGAPRSQGAAVEAGPWGLGLNYLQPEVQEQGEDGPFCRRLIEAGVVPHYAPGVRCSHHMRAPVRVDYLTPEWHRRMACFHANELAELREAYCDKESPFAVSGGPESAAGGAALPSAAATRVAFGELMGAVPSTAVEQPRLFDEEDGDAQA